MGSGECLIAADLARAARFCACPNCERLAKRAADIVLTRLTLAVAQETLLNPPTAGSQYREKGFSAK